MHAFAVWRHGYRAACADPALKDGADHLVGPSFGEGESRGGREGRDGQDDEGHESARARAGI